MRRQTVIAIAAVIAAVALIAGAVAAGAQAPPGSRGQRAEARADAKAPRPASERIPSGVRRIAVSTEQLGGKPRLVASVTGASQIKRIVSWVDRLPLAQPGPVFCPADYGRRVVLRFLSGSRVLATAVADGAGCGDVKLTIRGRSEPELTGGPGLIAHLASLLRRSLP